MNKYLLVTIGPVQSYIAQSRKIIDFFNSSRLIGDILKGIAYKIKLQIRDKIILPNMNIEKYMEASSIPNYFIVELTNNNDNQFNNIEKEIKKYYNEVFNNLVKKIEHEEFRKGLNSDNEILKEHISDIFDIYSIKVEANTYREGYTQLYEKLEKFKNTRTFNHYFKIGEAGKKCTMCGQRNSVFYKSVTNEDKKYKNKYYIPEYRLSEKEGICFSCYVKRFYPIPKNEKYNENDNFPSTVNIAVMGWENKINKELLEEFSSKIENALESSDLYKKCYYYKDIVLNEAKKNDNKAKKNNSEAKCKDIFYRYNKSLFLKYQPTKYYALIKADIDDLGKWISGKYLDNQTQGYTFLESQEELSKAIIELGTGIEKAFKKNPFGRTIYTGGDDFLLFVTLEELFRVIELLDNGIEEVNKRLGEKATRKLTMSKSITIAHHTTPLQNVLNITKSNLDIIKKKFKESEGSSKVSKDGTVITFITRSNTYRTSMFRNANSMDYININNLKSVVQDFQYNISKSFINQLESNFNGLDSIMQYKEMLNIKRIFKSEIMRLLKRKGTSSNKFSIQQTLIKLLNQGTIQISNNYYQFDYNNIFNFLHIADNISRELLKESKDELLITNTL